MNKVIKFSANWCMPCKAIAPVFENFKNQYKSEGIQFQFIDVDEHKDLVEKYNVRSVPTIVFVKDDVEVNRLVGLQNKKDYMENIEALLP